MPFHNGIYVCGTCNALSIYGGVEYELDDLRDGPPLLYPRGPSLQPPAHTVVGRGDTVPEKVAKAFTEAWPLRHTNPTAFANQTRRALEFVCQDRGAVGKDLHQQLQDLADKKIFPPGLADTALFLKDVGNMGSHATDADMDPWDAELVEELFRAIVDYVYVVPARVARLRERLQMESNRPVNPVLGSRATPA